MRACAGAAALFLAGVLVGTGGLAHADPAGLAQADPAHRADLSVSAASTQLAKDVVRAKARPFTIVGTNSGPHTARDVVLHLDFTRLDDTKVRYVAPRGCARTGQSYRCGFGPVASEGEIEFSVALYSTGRQGLAGSFGVSIASATADPDRTNNSTEVQVEVVGHSLDLVAVAFDVYADDDTEPIELAPVTPGHRAWLHWFAVNAGSARTRGVSYTINLPAHVTFAEHRDGCSYSSNNRRMTCQDWDAVLTRGHSGAYVADPVRVVVDRLAGWRVLAGGTVSAYALEELTGAATAQLEGVASPWVKALTPAQQERLAESDRAGNVARYRVHVAPGQAAGAGGGLPITGVQAGLIGGLGLAALTLGGVLFAVARRRRLILVTPDERAPSA